MSVYAYLALWVSTAVLYQALPGPFWVTSTIAGLGCGGVALMGIAGRQWIRGETVGS